MTYAKRKITQSEFVSAWWEAQDRKALEKLKRHYPGIEAVNFFDGMEYADKLRNIPNNALRRAGLKPKRRNGERKKERTILHQASMQKLLRATDRMVSQIAAIEFTKMSRNFADVCEIGETFTANHYQENTFDELVYLYERSRHGSAITPTPFQRRREWTFLPRQGRPFIIGCDLAQGTDRTGYYDYHEKQEEKP